MTTERGTALVRLSSRSTLFWKRAFTPLWSSSVGLVTLLAWLDVIGDSPAPDLVKWVLLLIWAVFTPLFARWFGGLEEVWLDGETLVVGDPRRGTRIALSDVCKVEESRFQRLKTISLELRHRTPAGNRVVFPAPRAWQWPFTDHPVVEALKDRSPALESGDPKRLR